MTPTTVVEVSARPIDFELTEPFAIAKGAPAVAANVLVTIRLADGTVGLGEAAPFEAVSGETQRSSLVAIESARAHLEGEDARCWRPLALMLLAEFPDQAAARCALEVALLDAWTQKLGQPLWTFFGGSGAELDTDMTITAGDRSQAAAAARAVVARGIHAIKVKVGALSPHEDAERLFDVHRAAPAATLTADANGGYTPGEALAFLEHLESRGVPLALFEQPVESDRWVEFMRAPKRPRVPICADESARSKEDVLSLVKAGAVDVVNIKPMKTGIVESLAIWHVARAAGVGLMIGGMVESSLAMTFSAHFAAGLGGFAFVDLDTPMFMKDDPFTGGFEQRGSRLSVAHVRGGHGVRLAHVKPPITAL